MTRPIDKFVKISGKRFGGTYYVPLNSRGMKHYLNFKEEDKNRGFEERRAIAFSVEPDFDGKYRVPVELMPNDPLWRFLLRDQVSTYSNFLKQAGIPEAVFKVHYEPDKNCSIEQLVHSRLRPRSAEIKYNGYEIEKSYFLGTERSTNGGNQNANR